MAVLSECPSCHRKQALRNKSCAFCGEDLEKAKRSRRVKFWINYQVAGKQYRIQSGYSIETARAEDGKIKGKRAENRILDVLPETTLTFSNLSDWYSKLLSVKKLASYDRIVLALANFNEVFGDRQVSSIKRVDLEDYQVKRSELGRAPATIDMEISIVKTMVTRAFDNDMIDGRALKAFRTVKRKLKRGTNARKRILTFAEYIKVTEAAADHLLPVLICAFNTGMRLGEIRLLCWSHIDRKNEFIRLPADFTKEAREKNIPINHHVQEILDSTVRHIDHDFVFTFRGRPITSTTGLKKSFIGACVKAKIPYGRENGGITFHDFRRSVKTYMLEAGVDKAHRDMILGHAMPGMDAHYLVAQEPALKNAMDKFTAWVDEKIIEARIGVRMSECAVLDQVSPKIT